MVYRKFSSLSDWITRFFGARRNVFDSAKYWEGRYRSGGNSGSGSYSRLAKFKAEVINDFVKHNHISSVIEFGCGDGNQLLLIKYPTYQGLDVSKTIITACQQKFYLDKSKNFMLYTQQGFGKHIKGKLKFDVALSLDVIFHLTEDDVFQQYMQDLFDSSTNYVIIYSSNFDSQIIPHVRHRKFTDWVMKFKSEWNMYKSIDNKFPYDNNNPEHTSYSNFYFFKRK